MELKDGKTYKTRDGKKLIKVKLTENGTNYKFRNCDIKGIENLYCNDYLSSGYVLSAEHEHPGDLVELVG